MPGQAGLREAGARRRRHRFVLLGFVSLSIPLTGLAQVPTSTHDVLVRPTSPDRAEVELSDQVFRDTVACVIGRQSTRTRNLLDTVPGTHEESRILSSFQSRLNSCYDGYRVGGRAMMFPSHVLRGVIAETYLGLEHPEGIAPAADVAADTITAWTRPRPVDSDSGQNEMLHAMARCVTARQPANVTALLRTAPVSAEERAAMRGLRADLGDCLDAGVEFTASPQALRGLLAEAALHYAEARHAGFDRVGRGSAGTE